MPSEPVRVQPPAPPRRHRHTAWLVSAALVAAALIAGGSFLIVRTTGTDDHRVGAESAALKGTVWRLLGYRGQQQRSNSLATLYVDRAGNLVADDSCELITAKVTGTRPSLRNLHVRNYNCTDSVGEVTFDRGRKALQDDPKWSISGDRLTVSGGGVVMNLAAAPGLPAPTADRPTYTDATWRLTKVVDTDGNVKTFRGAATLKIDGDQLLASDTCNAISGRATIDGNQLRVHGDGLSETAMACPGNEAQNVVDDVLADGATLDLNAATLTVKKDGKGTLTYQWQPADAQATDRNRLTATGWKLRSVVGGPAGTDATLKITSSGALSLDAACESVTASANVGDGRLTTSGLAAEPKSGCPPEVSTVQSLLASGTALWRIDGGRLVINQQGPQAFALVFDPVRDVPAGNVELPGTWRLTGIEQANGNSASGSGSSDSGITLKVTNTGFLARTPCGSWTGGISLGAKTVTVGSLSAGAPSLCQSDEANGLWKVLHGTLSWTIDSGQLKLTNGSATLTFEH